MDTPSREKFGLTQGNAGEHGCGKCLAKSYYIKGHNRYC